MQQRVSAFVPRSPLEAVLSRQDRAAVEFLTECLALDRPIDPEAVPPPSATPAAAADQRDVEG
jgi:hypothetical protein